MPLESLQNGRYQTVRELGSGSMGEVYLVDDTVIGRKVAIKVMRANPAVYPDSNTLKDAVRLFKREAQAIARLEHPHILPLFDFGEEKREQTVFTYMVMPHCQEGSLANWLQEHRPNQPLSPDETAYFVEQAAQALQYSHEHGIIHQDVKPSNFLVRTHTSGQLLPDLLLADFGIARMGAGTTITTITAINAGPCGTPRYMPPEQWEGKPVPASDQYALAVMAYQLLTQSYPFKGDQVLQLMYQHLQAVPEAPSKRNPRIPPAIDTVILRALAKQPEQRFPSVKAFALALRQALQGKQSTQPGLDAAPHGSIPTVTMPAQPAQQQLVLPANNSFTAPPVRANQPSAARVYHPPIRERTPQPRVPSVHTPVPAQTSWAPSTLPPVQLAKSGKASRGRTFLLTSLLLLIVLAGAGAGYYFYNNRISTPAPPKPDNANPYTSSMPRLLYSDPLSRPYMWQSLPNNQLTAGFCLFQQGTYHAASNVAHTYTLCPAASQQPATDNMTFEVHMQIQHGFCGGVLFRGDFQQGNFYYFDVCYDGKHYLATYKNFAELKQLPTSTSQFPALKADANATVTLGIVARGNALTFYLDGQKIDALIDSTYTSGQIALLCFAIDGPTEVTFSQARLWTA